MDFFFIASRIILAFLIGAAIGLEREINEKTGHYEKRPSAVLGIRSFSFVTVFGAIIGLLATALMPLALVVSGAFLLLLLIFYYFDVKETGDRGITTEIALIFSFLIGLLLILNIIPIQLTLALTVGVLLLLSQKDWIKDTVSTIQQRELNAFISFAIIAIAILPFLPNTSYALNDIPGLENLLSNLGLKDNSIVSISLINPFKIWLYVALITGVDLIGYILERTVGQKKGWLLASIAGGFVSSTATTQSLAQESKGTKKINHLIAAAILANLVSFIQIAILIAPINTIFFVKLLPVIALMLVASSGTLLYFLRTQGKKEKVQQKNAVEPATQIINLKAALTFALLFLVISFVSKVALVLFGDSGFLLTSGIGAFIGLDAVMINTGQLVGQRIDISLAVLAFILANAVNLSAKTFYSFSLGAKDFSIKFGISMLLVVGASIVGFLLFV